MRGAALRSVSDRSATGWHLNRTFAQGCDRGARQARFPIATKRACHPKTPPHSTVTALDSHAICKPRTAPRSSTDRDEAGSPVRGAGSGGDGRTRRPARHGSGACAARGRRRSHAGRQPMGARGRTPDPLAGRLSQVRAAFRLLEKAPADHREEAFRRSALLDGGQRSSDRVGPAACPRALRRTLDAALRCLRSGTQGLLRFPRRIAFVPETSRRRRKNRAKGSVRRA